MYFNNVNGLQCLVLLFVCVCVWGGVGWVGVCWGVCVCGGGGEVRGGVLSIERDFRRAKINRTCHFLSLPRSFSPE